MELLFQVSSPGSDSSEVKFWREGDDLFSKCTCPASKKYKFCRHGISLIFGNFSIITSNNKADLEKLKQMVAGCKQEELFNLIKKSMQSINLINERLSLTVKDGKRNNIGLVDAYKFFKENGFGKGNGSANYLDIYDKDSVYVGSVKLQSNIFENELENSFYKFPIKTLERVDNLLYNNSTSLYYFFENSSFDKLLQEEAKMDDYKERLRID